MPAVTFGLQQVISLVEVCYTFFEGRSVQQLQRIFHQNLLLQRFLLEHNLIGTLRTLELETGCTLPEENEDVAFFRELIYDGRWEDVELLMAPLSTKSEFDAAPVLFECRRQRFLEMFAGNVTTEGAVADEDNGGSVTVMKLVAALRSVESVAPNKQVFNSLCYILTLSSVNDHPEYAKWTMYSGRNACFQAIKERLVRLFPSGVYGDQGVKNSMQTPAKLEQLLGQAAALQALTRASVDPRLIGQLRSDLRFDPSVQYGVFIGVDPSSLSVDHADAARITSQELNAWSHPVVKVTPLSYDIPVPPSKAGIIGDEATMRASASSLSLTLGRLRRSMNIPLPTGGDVRSPEPLGRSRRLHAPEEMRRMRQTMADIQVSHPTTATAAHVDEPETKLEQAILDDRMSRSVSALLARQSINPAVSTPIRASMRQPTIHEDTRAEHSDQHDTVEGLTKDEVQALRGLLRRSLALESPARVVERSGDALRFSTTKGHTTPHSGPYDARDDGFAEDQVVEGRSRRKSALKWEVPVKGDPSRPVTADGSLFNTANFASERSEKASTTATKRPATAKSRVSDHSPRSPQKVETAMPTRKSKWMSVQSKHDTAPSSPTWSTPPLTAASPAEDRVSVLLGSFPADVRSIPTSSVNSEWLRASKAPLKSGPTEHQDPLRQTQQQSEDEDEVAAAADRVDAEEEEQTAVPGSNNSTAIAGLPMGNSAGGDMMMLQSKASQAVNSLERSVTSRSGSWMERVCASMKSNGVIPVDEIPSLSVVPKAVYRDTQPIRAVAFAPVLNDVSDSVLFMGSNAKTVRALHAPSTRHTASSVATDPELDLPVLPTLHEWSGVHLGSVYALSVAELPASEQLLVATCSNDTTLKVSRWNTSSSKTTKEDGISHLGSASAQATQSISVGLGTLRDCCWLGAHSSPPAAATTLEQCSANAAVSLSGTAMIACVGGAPYAVKVYDMHALTSSKAVPIVTLTGHSDTVHAVKQWGSDGRQLVSCSADGTVRQWDIRMRTPAATMVLSGGLHQSISTTGVYAPGVSLPPAAAAGATTTELHALCVRNALTDSPRELIVGCGNGTIALIDLLTRTMIAAASPHTDEVRSVDCVGPLILSGSFDGSVVISAVTDGLSPLSAVSLAPVLTRSDHLDKVLCTRWHPSAPTFVSSSADKTVLLWDVEYA